MKSLRNNSVEITLLGILLLAVLYFAYLAYGLLSGSEVSPQFSGEQALINARRLVEFGPRTTGSSASQRAGDWLSSELRSMGWDVTIEKFDVSGIPARNIIGIRGPESADAPVGIIATHYDTRLVADADSDPANRLLPGDGANTSASGAAVLLELANVLDVEASGHTVCLAFFDAEANVGLPNWPEPIGSLRFWENIRRLSPRCAAPEFFVLVEQIGHPDLSVRITTTNNRVFSVISQLADELGYATIFATTPISSSANSSVNSSIWFEQANVPNAVLTDYEYAYQHTTADTIDKLSADSLGRIGRILETWIEQGADLAPAQ
jgi:hypothetical protein